MKQFITFIAFFAFLIGFSVTAEAQLRYNTKITKVQPKIRTWNPNQFQYRPNCPDLAGSAINFQMVRKYNNFNGLVKITGIVKNIGSQHFSSSANQMTVALYEISPGGSSRMVARQSFSSVPAGRTVQVSWNRRWYTGNEFPPSYKVCVIYDPDIKLDGNKANDDCNSSNNCKQRAGGDINRLFSHG